MNYKIYVIKNRETNDKYIGLTKSIKKRWKRHLAVIRNLEKDKIGMKLYQNILKYGIDNFDIELITSTNNFFEARELEKHYIAKMEPNLNSSKGGEYNLMSDETRKKISKALKGRDTMPKDKRQQAIKRLIKASQTEEAKAKRNASLSKMWKENPEKKMKSLEWRRKRVQCVETGVIYNSLTEAGKSINSAGNTISMGIKQGRKVKGYTFVFVNKPMHLANGEIK